MEHILIVDDDRGVRTLLGRILERAGYRVTEAADGRQAMEMVRRDQPALVITDIFMPEQDGLEIVRELRLSHPATGVIAISGGGVGIGLDHLPHAAAFGAHRTLNKPFSSDQVLEAVRSILAPEGPLS